VLHRLALLDAGAPHTPGLGHGGGLFGQACVGVEQLALGIRTQQQLVRVLAVDIDELVAHLAQLRQRCRGAIDEGLAAAAGVDSPAQQHGAAVVVFHVARQFALGQPRIQRWVGVEGGTDAGTCRAFADHACVGPFTQHQGERVDEDRLARAGFTREDGKAGGEVEVERVDDDEVADR